MQTENAYVVEDIEIIKVDVVVYESQFHHRGRWIIVL